MAERAMQMEKRLRGLDPIGRKNVGCIPHEGKIGEPSLALRIEKGCCPREQTWKKKGILWPATASPQACNPKKVLGKKIFF